MTKAKTTPAAKTTSKAADKSKATAPAADTSQENSNASLQSGTDATAGAAGTTQPPADGADDTKAKTTPEVTGGGQKLLRQVVIEKMNFGTMKMEPHHDVREDDATELPESLTLFAMVSFIDEDGQQRSWGAGQVVTDPEEMRALIARGALFTE